LGFTLCLGCNEAGVVLEPELHETGSSGIEEKRNKEDNDVAKLVLKFDAKCDVKVTAQGKSQKSNVSFIKESGKCIILLVSPSSPKFES